MNSLKKGRLEKGFKQRELASILGMKQNTYSDKENMKITITLDEAFALERILEIPIQELFKDWKYKNK